MNMLVVLAPFTPEERREFTSALVADHVDHLVGQGESRDPLAAQTVALAEIEAELEAGVRAGDEFWVAKSVGGASGRNELRLNVWDSNESARRLYKRAGYEEAERFPGKSQLRKRLTSVDTLPPHPG